MENDMSNNVPKVTIDLNAASAVVHARLAPYVLHKTGSVASCLKQLARDYGCQFELELVPYSLEAARIELDAAAEKCADAMSRSPALADRVKAILKKADATEEIKVIAACITELTDMAANPFLVRS
jgi:hypothetical protein